MGEHRTSKINITKFYNNGIADHINYQVVPVIFIFYFDFHYGLKKPFSL